MNRRFYLSIAAMKGASQADLQQEAYQVDPSLVQAPWTEMRKQEENGQRRVSHA